MYCNGLGFAVLGRFQGHNGFDGVILGPAGGEYHLEFTCEKGHSAARAPTEENLLVFYVPDPDEWRMRCGCMHAAGFKSVASRNPYWDRQGRTFEDPDGYRVVIQQGNWSV
jgi:hypothetical protein